MMSTSHLLSTDYTMPGSIFHRHKDRRWWLVHEYLRLNDEGMQLVSRQAFNMGICGLSVHRTESGRRDYLLSRKGRHLAAARVSIDNGPTTHLADVGFRDGDLAKLLHRGQAVQQPVIEVDIDHHGTILHLTIGPAVLCYETPQDTFPEFPYVVYPIQELHTIAVSCCRG